LPKAIALQQAAVPPVALEHRFGAPCRFPSHRKSLPGKKFFFAPRSLTMASQKIIRQNENYSAIWLSLKARAEWVFFYFA